MKQSLRILISGANGLIGQALLHRWQAAGHAVITLSRSSTIGSISWDPSGNEPLDPASVSGFDVVVHLAGEPVASERWTPEKKARIHNSRAMGTATLSNALAKSEIPPRVFISASGINYYGDRGDQIIDESTLPGESFLADVCNAWEAAAAPMLDVARVVFLRIGMVLAANGGPLGSIIPAFRFGLGGPIAGGKNYLSWITLTDTLRAIDFAIENECMRGPINIVAPEPVTNRRFTKALAAALHRPAIFPIPGWAVRIFAGELANESVLCSIRGIPTKLIAAGFEFKNPAIERALAEIIS